MDASDRLPRRPSSWLSLGLVGAITVVGLLVRLPSFGDSLFADELSTYFIVTGNDAGRVVELLQGNSVDLNPPGFLLAAWATDGLLDAPQGLRLSSLLAGTAAIPLTYLLGAWTVGRPAGLVGAALMALSPFLIFYGTEARAYGLVLALVLLSTLALLRGLDTGRWGWWAAYAAFSCAAIYTHYTPVFLLAAQFAWAFLTHPEARRALLAANVAAAVGYLPWLPTLLDNTDSQGAKTIGILNPFDLRAVRLDLGRWSLGHPYMPIATVPGNTALVIGAAGLAAGLAGLVARARGAAGGLTRPRPADGIVLVLVLALATPVGLGLYSAIGDSVWEPRNLTVSWPGLALAAGALVASAGGPLRVAAVGLVLVAAGIGAVKMLDRDHQRPEYEEAASLIAESGAARAVLVEVPAPTPGPLAPLGDVAFAVAGGATPPPERVLRLGAPPLDALLRARPYAPVPVPRPQDTAARAERLARGGTLYLAAPGAAPVGDLRAAGGVTVAEAGLEPAFGTGPPAVLMAAALSPLTPFVATLAPDFRHVQTRTFPGFVPVSVYVFRDLA